MSVSTKPKILVIRNDKLGDFMLSLPAFKLLKQAMPDSTLHALVPEYTRDIALACDAIDDVIIDPGNNAPFNQQRRLFHTIKQQHYDAVITLFSTSRIGLLVWLAGIKYRLAPATKLAQIFYNQRLIQRRSRSEQPEYRYNLDLAARYLQDYSIKYSAQPEAPFLHFPQNSVVEGKHAFLAEQNVNTDSKLVVIHPGSGGSANNLSLEQYVQLIKQLKLSPGHYVVITAGPGELGKAEILSSMLKDIPHSIYYSERGLVSFAQFLQSAVLFISGSTGPLHIAGALDVPTAAFYPRRRSATALRWQTLNSKSRRLGFMPPKDAEEQDMQSIDLGEAAKQISDKFL